MNYVLKQERPLLKCHSHGPSLGKWPVCENADNVVWRKFIMESGLSPLLRTTYSYCNKVIVSSMVERWHPETNTFHLPFGEMGISLDDVQCILDLPIVGRPVCHEIVEDAEMLLQTCLGVTESVAKDCLGGGVSVTFEWLRKTFSPSSTSTDIVEVERSACAYLLYLLGSTLFVDKSVTKVFVIPKFCKRFVVRWAVRMGSSCISIYVQTVGSSKQMQR